MPQDFAIRHEPQDHARHVIAVCGEIDVYTAPDLKRLLGDIIDAGATGIVLDLSRATFLDSTGLGVLIAGMKRLRSRRGVLTIVNVDEGIARTFAITGLDQLFTICTSRDAALGALGHDGPTV